MKKGRTKRSVQNKKKEQEKRTISAPMPQKDDHEIFELMKRCKNKEISIDEFQTQLNAIVGQEVVLTVRVTDMSSNSSMTSYSFSLGNHHYCFVINEEVK